MKLVKRHHAKIAWALVLALLLSNIVSFTGGFVAHDRIVQLMGPHGLVEPPAPAVSRAGQGKAHPHVGGYRPASRRVSAPRLAGGVLPTAVDLSAYNPSVGDQGNVNSCVSWAIGYYLRTWYLKRDGAEPAGGLAPMYLYSQVTGGQNEDTSFIATLNVLASTGIAPERDYPQGYTDYWQLPTAAERAAAAPYAVAHSTTLFAGAGQGLAVQDAIKNSIASGTPVVIGIPVYANFYNAGPASYYVDGAAGTYYGGHALFASKYDANGLWVENQWGTGWGLGGWVELSWAFVDSYAFEANALVLPAPPRPTATATPRPRPTATLTPRPRPSPTPRPKPTATPKPTVHKSTILTMLRDQWLRSKPDAASTRLINVPQGTRITPVKPPTPHWYPIRYKGVGGWVLSSNVGLSYLITLVGVHGSAAPLIAVLQGN